MGNDVAKTTLDQLFDQVFVRAQSSMNTMKQQRQQLEALTQENQGLLGAQSQLEAEKQALAQQIADLQQQLAEAQQQQDSSQGLEEANCSLQEANRGLEEENQRLLADNQTLSERLGSLQGRIKEIARGSLLDSSEALLAMIRESMQDDEQPVEAVAESEPEEPLPEKFSAKDILDQWCKRYPKAFSNPCMQPLKIGIHEDLAASEKLPDHWIRRALAGYVRSPRYLRLLKAGAVRLDLSGNNAGFITEEEAQHAAEQLEDRRVQRQQKEQAHREKEENRRLNSKLAQLVNKHT